LLAVPAAGSFLVTLLLSENAFSSAGSRRFDASSSNTLAVEGIDVFKLAGGKFKAYNAAFVASAVPVGGGGYAVKLSLRASVNNAMFSGILVTRSALPLENAAPGEAVLCTCRAREVGQRLGS
jgi:hypothetical protein